MVAIANDQYEQQTRATHTATFRLYVLQVLAEQMLLVSSPFLL